MKNLKQLLGLAMMALVVFSSCSKEEVTSVDTEKPEVNLELFETTNLDELITLLDLQETNLEDASFIELEKPTMSQEVESRTCCDVGSIVNLMGGTNRFRIPLEYDENGSFIITVWKGNQFWSSGSISFSFDECTLSYHLTDVDYFAPIQVGESYLIRVFLYDGTGPFCDSGELAFIGE